MKQCFCWWCYENCGISPDVLFAAAARIGYLGVELIPDTMIDLAKDAGLAVVTRKGHESIDCGLNDPSQHDRIERELMSGLDIAHRHGIETLIAFSGSRRPGLTDQQGIENTCEGLARIARSAEQAGVTVALELLNSVELAGYQADHTAFGVAVVERIGSPRVKLLYDICHMQIMEGNLIRTIQASNTQIAHYHTGGVPGRHEIDGTQEINYPAVFRTIQATGYDGWIGHEFIPTRDPIAGLEAAYALTQESFSD